MKAVEPPEPCCHFAPNTGAQKNMNTTKVKPTPHALSDEARALSDVTPSLVLALRHDVVVYANPSCRRMLGAAAEAEIVGQRIADLVVEEDRDLLAALLRDPAEYMLGARMRLKRFDGERPTSVELRAEPLAAAGGATMALVARDISDFEHAAAALRTRERRLNAILDTVFDAIVIVAADGSIERFNRAAEQMFGWRQGELIGRRVELLMADDDAREHQRHVARAVQGAQGAGAKIGRPRELIGRRKDGTTLPIEVTLTHLNFDDRQIFIGVVRDLTERKLAEERLRHQAHHDPLTGLPNRTLLSQILNARLSEQRGPGGAPFVVIGVDLDRFKSINDLFGFTFGNKALTEIAGRLARVIGPEDLLARPSGDEFVIVLRDEPSDDALQDLCARILNLRSTPVEFDGAEASIGMSVGVVRCAADEAVDADAVMQRLETTVGVAKESGRNAYRRYSNAIGKRRDEFARLEFDLRRSVDQGGLQLLYQPKVSLTQNRVVGMEALIRWNRVDETGETKVVSPASFIPIAEESGLIVRIGAWALEEACRTARRFATGSHHDLKVAVNLSPQQFRDARLSDKVRAALQGADLPPQNLELEITESGLVDGVDDVVRLMDDLKSLGVTIAIDDFGTGYSSLSYLKKLPIDVLKIDQSFMRGVPADQEDNSIVRAVIGIAQTLELDLVAEGVETPQQVEFLRALNCEVAQGYLYARPLAADAFGAFLRDYG